MLCNVLETSVEGENGAGLMTYCSFIWVKVSKNGPSKICGRQPLQNWSDMVCLSRPYHFKFFKDCLSQVLLGTFLNTLAHI